MNDRSRQAIAIALIGASAMVGLLGMSIVLSIVSAAGLSLLAVREQIRLRARYAAIGAGTILSNAQLASVVNGCVTAVAAWLVGAAFRMMLQAMQ